MADTQKNVAEIATEKDMIDTSGIALLGTMVDPQGPTALLRTATGDIRKVRPGDRVGLAQVRAIGAGRVQISGLAGVETLNMPKG